MPAEKKYKCQFCNRAFSRSEHRSRHERSHTKERPFKCMKCRSTFVRRDLLLRHDRTVHAKDGGTPLTSEGKKRSGPKTALEPQPPTPTATPYNTGGDHGDFPPMASDGDDMNDLEAAALLMTDFHHKAMASQEPEFKNDSDMINMSHNGSSLLNSPGPYGAAAMALPEMPWDSLLPNPAVEHKAVSLNRVPSLSQETQLSFTSAGPPSTHSHHLPPLLDGPGPPSFNGAMTASDMGTPGALSPYPSMLGPVSPVDYRRSPGPAQNLSITKAPQLDAEEQCARVLENIKRWDTEVQLLETFRLPDRTKLNRYLTTYFGFFHHHLPFLHPASFNPTEVAAPLLLAVLSIGALYTFDHDEACMLHIGSKVLVTQFLQQKENFSSRKSPLWTMQTTLLNMVFESWSGDSKGLEWACSIKGLLANMVAGNRYELNVRIMARDGAQPSHSEWIEDEESRRSYYAVYVFFGLLTLTYNHTPAINFNELASLDLPSSETLWNLEPSDEAAWQESLTAATSITFREAHDKLFQGEKARYSAFGTRVMINALFLEVWYHKRSPEALQDVVTEWKLRLALETWEKSLEECESERLVVHSSAPHKGHPLIFNAKAMYRNVHARLHVDLKSVQEALRYHDAYEVAAAMTHARDKVKRSPEMIKVIQHCYDCIEVAATQGIRWVARTSATNWSIEHPLCGVDMIVVLSLWLWRVEHDDEQATPEESAMYSRIRSLFDEDSVDQYGAKLSATVARLYGSMIDEVVVWGITKLIGESFKLHAQSLVGYEDSIESHGAGPQPNSTLAAPPVEAMKMSMQTAY